MATIAKRRAVYNSTNRMLQKVHDDDENAPRFLEFSFSLECGSKGRRKVPSFAIRRNNDQSISLYITFATALP